ncbi:hypothetical protein K438DRAFT_1988029 [Mycena galopus ATCC 62051]|nr:hypothetical protein K438DRAFT_1988029 [Mycena galopus ATCC 62051]
MSAPALPVPDAAALPDNLSDFELCDMEFRSINACGYCEYMVIYALAKMSSNFSCGSAMAVEDAAVLGSLLSYLSHRTQLDMRLRAYPDIRYDRTRETQLAAFAKTPHIPPGGRTGQRSRRGMKAGQAHEREECVDDADGNAHDVEAEAETWWVEKGQVTLSRGE